MQITGAGKSSVSRADELSSMMAMLCSYDNLFGPHAPQTMRLTKDVGIACWRCGESGYARVLLTRAIRDLGQYLGRSNEARMEAVIALQELLAEEGEYENATALQNELIECAVERFGTEHAETIAIRNRFVALLLKQPVTSLRGAA
jgi:hypothetical protein